MGSICLSLTQPTLEENLRCAVDQARWIHMVELRADFLAATERSGLAEFPERLRQGLGRPLDSILTVRRQSDGGHFTDSEQDRRTLLAEALKGGFSYIDLEDDVYTESPMPAVLAEARRRGTALVRSIHDFAGTPATIVPTMLRMGRDGTIPKMAVTPRDAEELLALFHAYDALAGRPFVLLGMGRVGKPSRVLSLAYGALWTYTSAPEAAAAAPGHTTPQEMAERYAAAGCSRDTAVFGVVGSPIGHSKSPQFHNAVFRERGMDALYLPFEAKDFPSFMRLAEHLGVRGLSVTIPHKAAAAAWAVESAGADPAVEATGACNTLLRDPASGGWRGVNTDIVGFLAPLEAATAGAGLPAEAVLVGAGGVARAALYALAERGIRVLLLNRTLPRARELADRMNRHFGGGENGELLVTAAPLAPESRELMRSYAGLIVQTTSVGMTPNQDADPIAFYEFAGTELVYDLVYTPEVTQMMTRAAGAGCRTVSGRDMFIRQAEEQARLFCDPALPSG